MREDSRESHSLAEDVLQGICCSAQRLLLPHHLGHDGVLPVIVEDHCGLRDDAAKKKKQNNNHKGNGNVKEQSS